MGVDFLRNSGQEVWEVCLPAWARPMHGLAGEGGVYASGLVAGHGGSLIPALKPILRALRGMSRGGECLEFMRGASRKEEASCHCVTTAEWELLSDVLSFNIENKHEHTTLLLLPRFPWEIYSHWRRDMRDMAMACDLRTVGPLERNGSVEGGIIFRIEKKWGRAMPACPRDVSGGT